METAIDIQVFNEKYGINYEITVTEKQLKELEKNPDLLIRK